MAGSPRKRQRRELLAGGGSAAEVAAYARVRDEQTARAAIAEAMQKILEGVASGSNVKRECFALGIDTKHFWAALRDNVELFKQYERAIVARGHVYGEQTVEIIDDAIASPRLVRDKYDSRVDPGWAQLVKTQIAARQDNAATLQPRMYGKRVEPERRAPALIEIISFDALPGSARDDA